MFIVKVLGVYFIIKALSKLRELLLGFVFDSITTTESDFYFELTLAILFAAIIIREGLW